MSEKETIFSSKIKYKGIFLFKDLYKFCYDWLTEETGLDIVEDKYNEKLSGDMKEIVVEWTGSKDMTDYFQFESKIKITISELKKVEINKGGAKVEMNSGSVEIGMKGNLVRDYDGKFETSAFKKFLRSIYEKWVIPSRIEHYEDKIIGSCDEFLNQAKSYLDLEGKK
ncbi:hypothetical protein A3K62_02760 [Candidatus Pacearchaeota archaeon RBG_16_35_8]|nr:MAG: hypothetical protein A3K62_02760 [Candidatus Pacearchaeota archaeon RBG_16_35_8]